MTRRNLFRLVGYSVSTVVLTVALYLMSQANYLLFHSVAEAFSITVAAALFALAWNARRMMRQHYLLFVGIGYVFVAALDLLHTLAYDGVGVFAGRGPNLPTQLWIAARALQAVTLLIAPVFLARRVRAVLTATIYGAVTALLVLSIFAWDVFPTCYRDGRLTPFKIYAEYVICIVLAAALVELVLMRRRLARPVLWLIVASIVATILSELAFTRYLNVRGEFNLLGHLIKIAAVYLIYKALVETGLRRPYELLFRDVRQKEQQAQVARADAQRQAALLDTVFEDMLEPVIVYDENGQLRMTNAAAIRTYGAQIDKLNAEQFWRLLESLHIRYPDGRPVAIKDLPSRRALLGEAVDAEELHFTDAAGQVKVIELSASPLRIGGRIAGAVTVWHDVTVRKQIEQSLRESEQRHMQLATELARSNQELAQYAYAASHDMQEPLRMVASFAELLERRYQDKLDDQANQYIAFMIDGVRRMQKLIQDLLTHSTVRPTPRKPVDLGEVLESVKANLAGPLAEADASVESGPLPTVLADRSQMALLFRNLLDNALKFRGDAPPRIRVEAAEDGAHWQVAVRDNGIGIDPRYHEQVFGLFKRLNPRSLYPGSGIGLSLCRKIIELHGGRIWIESQAGQGAVVKFTLPRREE